MEQPSHETQAELIDSHGRNFWNNQLVAVVRPSAVPQIPLSSMILRGKWRHRLVNSVQRRSSTTRSRTAAEDHRRGKKRYDELPSTVTWSQQCRLSMGAIKDWENQNLWHHKDPKEILVRDLNSKKDFSLPDLVKCICLQPQVTLQACSGIWSSLL